MSPKRNVYLQMKSLEEARNIVFEAFGNNRVSETERLNSPDAVGRVLAEPVVAQVSSPNYHAAAMDGFAVKAETTFGAHETKPRDLRLGRDAYPVNTGHVLPAGVNAVIMIEHVQIPDEQTIRIEAPAFPWQHVRRMGEDIVATEMLFARRHRITPYCAGALLSAGVFKVTVFRRPNVLIIPTGGELVDWRGLSVENLRPGQVIESNSYVMAKLVEALGGTYTLHPRLGDDTDAIKSAVVKGVVGQADLVLILGGSSAGSEDFARACIADAGEVLVHGITMMPGKPAIVGRIKTKPVFGIPGYPVSAIMAFEQLVQPLIAAMQGRPEPERPVMAVMPTRKMASKLGMEEFVRVKIGQVGDRTVATALPRGAGCITSITEADGIIRIPAHVEGIAERTTVNAELLRPARSVGNTLIAVGSHDNSLDVLADELRGRDSNLSLSSSHVGSMGGLMAIKRGVCHLAGTHLLDERDGSYNISYLRTYLADVPVRLVHLVMREQGLILPAGNPKNIRDLADLVREDVTLVNRQGGSGTRILLDFRLKQLGLAPGGIRGYDREEFTHMAVAVAVLSGSADVGLGIHAAARALNLDFIPVVTEQYDLVIPEAYFETAALQTLLGVIAGAAFRKRVSTLGGYNAGRSGDVLL